MKITPLDQWINQKIEGPAGVLLREELEKYQLLRLKETLRLVQAQSPFYQALLAGVEVEDIKGLEELERIPFTFPENLRAEPFSFLCVRPEEISRIVTLSTSGTTGDPKRFFFTREDQELTIDFFHHGMSTLVGPGDSVLILLPGERPGSVGDLLQQALGRLGVSAAIHGPVRDAEDTLAQINEHKYTCLVGIPTQVLSLARHERAGYKRGASLKTVLLSTDYVPRSIVKAVEDSWDCRVYNHYGMTETGLGGGVECAALSGYHLREADLLFEVVDPQTGKAVADGMEGEVVFTTLTRRGMPLIRYRTGDYSRFIPEPCPCGTALKRLETIKYRQEAGSRLSGGGILRMSELDEALFALNDVLDFSASLRREGSGERLQLVFRMTGSDERIGREQVSQALQVIPAVRRALENRELELEIKAKNEDWQVNRGTSKRRVLDLRKE